MWDNTIMAVFSDNGGPIYLNTVRPGMTPYNGGANNYPLKGGKMGQFEGGVRVNAFVTGGALPASRRGAKWEGFFAVEDWYATCSELAGVDSTDDKAKKYNLPEPDSVSHASYLTGDTDESDREYVMLAAATPYPGITQGTPQVQGLIRNDGYKLIIGVNSDAMWLGPFYPNSSNTYGQFDNTSLNICGPKIGATLNDQIKSASTPVFDTVTGTWPEACLYNVLDDPTEHNLLDTTDPKYAQIFKDLSTKMRDISETRFDVDRGEPTVETCDLITSKYNGFLGPFRPSPFGTDWGAFSLKPTTPTSPNSTSPTDAPVSDSSNGLDDTAFWCIMVVCSCGVVALLVAWTWKGIVPPKQPLL